MLPQKIHATFAKKESTCNTEIHPLTSSLTIFMSRLTVEWPTNTRKSPPISSAGWWPNHGTSPGAVAHRPQHNWARAALVWSPCLGSNDISCARGVVPEGEPPNRYHQLCARSGAEELARPQIWPPCPYSCPCRRMASGNSSINNSSHPMLKYLPSKFLRSSWTTFLNAITIALSTLYHHDYSQRHTN